MRILIHCNGGIRTGIGHVVRALSLAEEATASGHEVTLVGDLSGALLDDLLERSPVKVQRLARPSSDALTSATTALDPDVVHVDSYYDVPQSWPRSPLFSNVEDGPFGRRAADVAIDPNLGAEFAEYSGRRPGVLLRGSRYAMVRRLVTARRGDWALRQSARRVLVVMGGSDATGVTPRVVAALAATRLRLQITAVARPELAAEIARVDPGWSQVDVRAPVPDLPALAVQQDFVISAAGTSVGELCCLGVPMGLVPVVDNQRSGFDQVVRAGAALALDELAGERTEKSVQLQGLRRTLLHGEERQVMSERAASLVDGLGAWRVVRAWEQLVDERAAGRTSIADAGRARIRLRRAAMDDAEQLLRWRNDSGTRASSRSREEATREGHLAWLDTSLRRDDRILLIAADATSDFGTVRWDRVEPSAWEVSVTIAPERRGKGLARPMLLAGEEALVAEVSNVTALVAVVQDRNEASRRLFEGAGFLPDGPADSRGFLTYRKPLLATT